MANSMQLTERITIAINNGRTSQLEVCISQYDIMSRIAKYSTSIDLFSLAITSRTAWVNIKGTDMLWRALTLRTTCCGFGVDFRRKATNIFPRPGTWPLPIYFPCSSKSPVPIESQLCVDCGSMVCKECRIHSSYPFAKRYGDPYDSLEGGSFYGIQLFAAVEVNETDVLSHPSNGVTPQPETALDRFVECYHPSKRRLASLPNFYSFLPAMEKIQAVGVCHDQESLHRSLLEVARARQIAVCLQCFHDDGPGMLAARDVCQGGGAVEDVGGHPCECTLSKRYMTAWRCMRCFIANDISRDLQDDEKSSKMFCRDRTTVLNCGCGGNGSPASEYHVLVCKWCGGSIRSREDWGDNSLLILGEGSSEVSRELGDRPDGDRCYSHWFGTNGGADV